MITIWWQKLDTTFLQYDHNIMTELGHNIPTIRGKYVKRTKTYIPTVWAQYDDRTYTQNFNSLSPIWWKNLGTKFLQYESNMMTELRHSISPIWPQFDDRIRTQHSYNLRKILWQNLDKIFLQSEHSMMSELIHNIRTIGAQYDYTT